MVSNVITVVVYLHQFICKIIFFITGIIIITSVLAWHHMLLREETSSKPASSTILYNTTTGGSPGSIQWHLYFLVYCICYISLQHDFDVSNSTFLQEYFLFLLRYSCIDQEYFLQGYTCIFT